MSAFFLEHPKETDLALFAGGESGPFARWRIERHVESCPRCQEIAVDFFRLPDQLNELADLPSLDWKQMAMAIESGVRADAAAARPPRRSWFLPPLAWQAGLVAASIVVGVAVVQYADQARPEPETIAAAKLEAPAPRPPVEEQQETVTAEAARTEVAAAAPQSKAAAAQPTLASDIAAPAAPPPPPPGALNEAGARRVSGAAQPLAAEAESAEIRLRNDAAARVGAVSALGDAAPVASGEAGVFRQARIAWAQLPVDAVNFDDAPVSLSGGYTAFAGAIVKSPNVTATNRSERTVVGFELVWIVGDTDASATALIQRQGVSMVPGAVTSRGGDRSWRLPAGIISPKMRIYLSRVSFEDGGAWSPSAEQIAGLGLIEPGNAYPDLELLPVIVEGADRP